MSEYIVGYGKPPKHSRYRKGQTGNRKGRPKRVDNPDVVLRKVLDRKIAATINGEKKKLRIREALVHKVLELANSGHPRALDWVRKFHQHAFESQPWEPPEADQKDFADEFFNVLKNKARIFLRTKHAEELESIKNGKHEEWKKKQKEIEMANL